MSEQQMSELDGFKADLAQACNDIVRLRKELGAEKNRTLLLGRRSDFWRTVATEFIDHIEELENGTL